MATAKTPIIDKNGKATHVHKKVGSVQNAATPPRKVPDLSTATPRTMIELHRLAIDTKEVENRIVSAAESCTVSSGAYGFYLSFTDSSDIIEFEVSGADKWITHPSLITDFEENYGNHPTMDAVLVETVVNGTPRNKWIEPDIIMAIDTALYESEDVLLDD